MGLLLLPVALAEPTGTGQPVVRPRKATGAPAFVAEMLQHVHSVPGRGAKAGSDGRAAPLEGGVCHGQRAHQQIPLERLPRWRGVFAMDNGHTSRSHWSVATSPPRWEIGIYAAGALALLGIAALNLWKLWRSGSYPAPSPFPNYDYRYLEQKYGAAYLHVTHKPGAAGTEPPPSRRPSLRADETFESIKELGSLELMSKDLAHYGPLKKSISADSLSSISSIGNNFGQDLVVGQVEVSLEYDGQAAALHVALLQGRDLLGKEGARH
ncbi:PREDICTED: LOW QUALITY PROTEIN: synaptotagmin-12 [Chaetura pelagica]|uniref:LOW QUALITY PROTEIN: synaptotagmin-12 n=1 Tax=Chaetura pelagica TaxID=8897 RepID=UPI0005237A88|nr:PREDICTED: LOW QUALITY PROTEIN: synaptotagmin-12 [Chaetura pelagica]